uniref:Caspase-3 n=1 Tax=Leptobrachium leishanense TaxID=445787 RepID=A0A8C5LLU0_9ANUR
MAKQEQYEKKFAAVGKWIDNNCYKMDYPEKSTCLILNMKEFNNPVFEELLRRDGTDKDAKDLRNVFERYGFRVRTEKNLTYAEIKTVMEKVATEDHSQRSSFACAVLSHGNEDGIFARDRIFRLRWLTQFISEHNCKSLAGKPKLFFIQACRGELYDQGIETDGGSEENSSLFTSVDQDFLLAYSTVPGYVAWKNTINGSWFIQSLCKILKENGNELELQQILTRVNCMVAKEYESSSENKEMPCVVSGLIKQLYLPVYKK